MAFYGRGRFPQDDWEDDYYDDGAFEQEHLMSGGNPGVHDHGHGGFDEEPFAGGHFGGGFEDQSQRGLHFDEGFDEFHGGHAFGPQEFEGYPFDGFHDERQFARGHGHGHGHGQVDGFDDDGHPFEENDFQHDQFGMQFEHDPEFGFEDPHVNFHHQAQMEAQMQNDRHAQFHAAAQRAGDHAHRFGVHLENMTRQVEEREFQDRVRDLGRLAYQQRDQISELGHQIDAQRRRERREAEAEAEEEEEDDESDESRDRGRRRRNNGERLALGLGLGLAAFGAVAHQNRQRRQW